MSKEWSSFRITVLLYILVLILPMSFYFISVSFKTIQTDTKVVHQTAWIGNSAEYLTHNLNRQDIQKSIAHIDNTFQNISNWVILNNDSKLYIGAGSLSQDFSFVDKCWEKYKNIYLKEDKITSFSLECWEHMDYLSTNVEKMVYLKQNSMINFFYFALTIAMILTLLIVYAVRTYIHMQIIKHAIYDHETKLYNKNYFISTLHASCSRSTRYNYPLSMVSITMINCENGCILYEKLTRAQLLTMFGGLILFLTRDADTACRYEGNTFFIILPDTEKEGAEILENRMRDALNSHDFRVTPKMEFALSSIQFDPKLDAETFLEEAKNLTSN